MIPVLRADRVSRTYPGGVQALRDVSLSIQEGEMVGIVGPLAFNGSSWDRQRNTQASTPLATVTSAKATQATADQVNYNGKGLLLHVKVANLAGTPTFTPRLQWKDNSGNYNTIWTAAAAINANGDKTYQLYPSAADAASHTESRPACSPARAAASVVSQ